MALISEKGMKCANKLCGHAQTVRTVTGAGYVLADKDDGICGKCGFKTLKPKTL